MFFKPVTSASENFPAVWTDLNPGFASAVSTHQMALAALVDLGLSGELDQTDLSNDVNTTYKIISLMTSHDI